MENQGKRMTPLQEMLHSVESSVRIFGLPPLPPLSKLPSPDSLFAPQGQLEETEKGKEKEKSPGQRRKSVFLAVEDVREVVEEEQKSTTPARPRDRDDMLYGDSYVHIHGSDSRMGPLPKVEPRVRQILNPPGFEVPASR
ncbi:MAG: hypothetical protein KAX25_04570 [Dehalococcoidia bacterium]|nr:hypothetical protein [Dehalococcoidia bacterium]